MKKQLDTITMYCDKMMIVNESSEKSSWATVIIAKLKKLIITCRHTIQRFLYGLKKTRKISVPKAIADYSEKLSNECLISLGNLQLGHKSVEDIDDMLISLRNKKEYKILFGKEKKYFASKDYVLINTHKTIIELQNMDRHLETFEKQLIDVSELHKNSIYDIDTIARSITLLSEAVKIYSRVLSWKDMTGKDDIVDLGVNINAKYDKPSL